MTPEQTQRLVEMLPTATSLREIARELGVNQRTVRDAAQPIMALMRAMGTLPPCGCGKERFHRWGCAIIQGQSNAPNSIPGHHRATWEIMHARRATVIDLIMTGASYGEIERQMGWGPHHARSYLRFLTPEQKAERKRLEAARILEERRERGRRKRQANAEAKAAKAEQDEPEWRLAA